MGMTKMSYPNPNGHAFKPSKRDPKLCAAVIGGFICAHKADHPRHAAEHEVNTPGEVAVHMDPRPHKHGDRTCYDANDVSGMPLASTPGEARTGMSDRTAAALADVAELRTLVAQYMQATRGVQSARTVAMQRLDRIEQALRQR